MNYRVLLTISLLSIMSCGHFFLTFKQYYELSTDLFDSSYCHKRLNYTIVLSFWKPLDSKYQYTIIVLMVFLDEKYYWFNFLMINNHLHNRKHILLFIAFFIHINDSRLLESIWRCTDHLDTELPDKVSFMRRHLSKVHFIWINKFILDILFLNRALYNEGEGCWTQYNGLLIVPF